MTIHFAAPAANESACMPPPLHTLNAPNANFGFVAGKLARSFIDHYLNSISRYIDKITSLFATNTVTLAILNNDLESLRIHAQALHQLDPELLDKYLRQALYHKSWPCFYELLKAGANIFGENPLWFRAIKASPEFAAKIPKYINKEIRRTRQLPFDGPRTLLFAVLAQNELVIDYLLTLDIDKHQTVSIPELNTHASPYQAAMISTKAIKRKFRAQIQPDPMPCEKNPWTAQFEEIMYMIADNIDTVQYTAVTNPYGNTHYNPVIYGITYPLDEIIYKMDWQQVYIDQHLIEGYGGITIYISGTSVPMNSFLKGETHYIEHLDPQTISNGWLLNAITASELNQRPLPDPNEVICRGQSIEDRLVRGHELSLISTAADIRVCTDYNKDQEPMLVLDENQGIDVTDLYGRSQLILLPTQLRDYAAFTLEGRNYNLAQTAKAYRRNYTTDVHAEKDAQRYTATFAKVISQIVNPDNVVSAQNTNNGYGQTFYNVVINGTTYDMFDITSKMDWTLLTLSEDTLSGIRASRFSAWDEQTYTNWGSAHTSANLVFNPVKLYDIDGALNLTARTTVPTKCERQTCKFTELYQDLDSRDKALIFQYTSITSKPLNSFLKGSEVEFRNNIPQHQKRWAVPRDLAASFDIQDPLNWWIYSARLTHALNKIKISPSAPQFCRGQTHADRHVRLAHSAPISATPDFKLCESYKSGNMGDIVVLDHFEGKDITALSFHPNQREFVQPPALLRDYRRKMFVQNERGYLQAVVKKTRLQP